MTIFWPLPGRAAGRAGGRLVPLARRDQQGNRACPTAVRELATLMHGLCRLGVADTAALRGRLPCGHAISLECFSEGANPPARAPLPWTLTGRHSRQLTDTVETSVPCARAAVV